MSSICSKHQGHDPACRLCNSDIRDIIPDYDDMLAKARRAGEIDCCCGFRYFRTTASCPLCGAPWENGTIVSDPASEQKEQK